MPAETTDAAPPDRVLNNTRLNGDLSHIQRALARVAASERGKHLVESKCRELDVTPAAVIWQSLFSDCLRVVYTAVAADGKLDDRELAAVYEFMFSIARHYANVLSGYREFAVIDEETIRHFLDHYAKDGGPFGERATHHWPGLTMCREAAKLAEADPEPLARYERMMSWLIPEACEIGGVVENDPKLGSKVAEIHGMRRQLAANAAAAAATKPAIDPRLRVFLSGAGVFAGVQQAASVFETDPFDVDKIHHEARTSFHEMVERAIAPEHHAHRGRILLVLGDSGSGKTHLLRGFRRHVQEYSRGFVAYAQMSAATDNYPRYLLQHVVDSLSRPYTGPLGERTGLHELASGLARLVEDPLRTQIEQLANGDWEGSANLRQHVSHLANALLASGHLGVYDTDLIRVLLYALYPDQRVTARVYKYLRCEDINPDDRQWIGGVVPRLQNGHPLQMICDLARLAYLTRKAALVLMIDQAELTGFDPASTSTAFKRAIDALYNVVSIVPTAVAVVACISDIYDRVRPEIGTSMIDRLERDPPVERLQLNRSYADIEAIVGRRLSWLYSKTNVDYRPEEPVYPIPPDQLRNLTNRRTRDVLQWCHHFQSQCVAAKKIVEPTTESFGPSGSKSTSPASPDADLDAIATAWNDACHASGIEVPDHDDGILELVTAAAHGVAKELGLALTTQQRRVEGQRLKLAGATQQASVLLAVTNKGYHRGAFGKQLEALREAAKKDTPVAVRTLEFPRGEASSKAIGQLVKSGGRRAYVDSSTLRTLVAFQKFRPPAAAERIVAWQRRDRPISSLQPMNDLFDLQRLLGAAEAALPIEPVADKPLTVDKPSRPRTPAGGTPTTKPAPRAKPAATAPAPAGRTGKPDTGRTLPRKPPPAAAKLHLGTAATFGGEPRTIELGSLLRHTGILGSSGSGKTTLALHLIEQLLDRDVAVIMIDRKGDLAGYAKPDWWKHAADPDRAKKLAAKLDVRLFTPGTSGGRPLALSIVPDLQQLPEHEHERTVQFAAAALASMLENNNGILQAILIQAISILAEHRRPADLTALIELIKSRDDQLLGRACYDGKHFNKLAEQLETVRIQFGNLFDAKAEQLTAETLIGRAADHKTPLAIVSTKFLGDLDRVQSWVAHLIGCLARFVARAPSAELHTVLMIDEADVFMPAGMTKPPSKEPLQDLLKRARAAGLGVMLASQSPADFDYRSREQINTWLLGRIADARSIEKMQPLFESRPAVGSKLGGQEAGRFVLLQDGATADLDRTPSLLRTEQLAEPELMALAAAYRRPAGGGL
ncbi:MAG TPA: helicase HerA-like domain-containing protein [Kofleriaceae bacterium]|nr:helicase HerA-like domain-containing protein [Kofleriaceae bacterium]